MSLCWKKIAKQAVTAGLRGKSSCQRAASSLGFATNSNSRLPPMRHMAARKDNANAQAKAARGIGELQGSGMSHALPTESSVDGTCLNNQLAGTAPLLESGSTAALRGASSTAVDSGVEVAEAIRGSTAASRGASATAADSGVAVAEAGRGSTAAFDAQTALPSALSNTHLHARHIEVLSATPSSGHFSLASPNAEADVDMPSALLNDKTGACTREEEQISGSAGCSPEEDEEWQLESPGRFAAAQFRLMQQRQQRLLERRLAALKVVEKTSHVSAQHLLQQSQHQQSSKLLASLQPVVLFNTMGEPAAKRAQHEAAEAVASSPVVLFSPGGPYCDKSKWFLSAGMVQVWQQVKMPQVLQQLLSL